MSNLQWKVLAVVAVGVLFSALGIYPIVAARYGVHSPGFLMDKALKLGLDLKGGVHLVLRVETDDALKGETDIEMERLREELSNRKINVTGATAVSPTQFRVDGVPPAQDADFRQAATEVQTNFDRGSNVNGSYTFTMKANVAINLRDEAVVQARQTIERRVNELGVTEPSIAQQGADQILVQLPGVTDVDKAKSIIGSPGKLELKIVEGGPSPTKESLLVNGQVPDGMEIVAGSSGTPGDSGTVYYTVRRAAAVTGRDLRNARPSLDQNNLPAVSFTLNSDGGRRFGKVSSENIGRLLAIILDGRVQSAPRLEGRITTDGQIFGSFTH
jgi:preprotein translocase subunit SecD